MSNQVGKKNITFIHLIVQFRNVKEKEKILKSSRNIRDKESPEQMTYKGTRTILTSFFNRKADPKSQ